MYTFVHTGMTEVSRPICDSVWVVYAYVSIISLCVYMFLDLRVYLFEWLYATCCCSVEYIVEIGSYTSSTTWPNESTQQKYTHSATEMRLKTDSGNNTIALSHSKAGSFFVGCLYLHTHSHLTYLFSRCKRWLIFNGIWRIQFTVSSWQTNTSRLFYSRHFCSIIIF